MTPVGSQSSPVPSPKVRIALVILVAAVLRMIEAYVGRDTFKKGVNAYLEAHAYANATSRDFWSAIAAASDKPVDRIMPSFITQPGVPVIRVSAACPANQTQVAMTQRRFLVDPAASAPATPLWQIPVCFALAPSAGMKARGTPSNTHSPK